MTSEGKVTIHFRRLRGDYRDWGLHIWGPTLELTDWESPMVPSGWDDYGIYWEVPFSAGSRYLNFIIHRREEKDTESDRRVDLQLGVIEVWVVEGDSENYSAKKTAQEAFLRSVVGNFLTTAKAYWLTRAIFFWPNDADPNGKFSLFYHPSGGIRYKADDLVARHEFDLEVVKNGLPPDLAMRFPHLKQGLVLNIKDLEDQEIQILLRGQLVLAARNSDNQLVQASGVQIQGVLDDMFAYNGPLGVSFESAVPTIHLWAPTAKNVTLVKYADSDPSTVGEEFQMTYDPASGLWGITGERSWTWNYYLFSVEVFTPHLGKLQTNLVTDPYSHSLAINSKRSQIVNLDDPMLVPEGWYALEKPTLVEMTDAVLYELHVRDFSAHDLSVAPPDRGKYNAFQAANSNGIKHLKRLAEAGVTHLHLLPISDNASYDEDQSRWGMPDYQKLAALPPDSEAQQQILSEIRGQDGYNWGYDPYHFLVPEGSYASNPDGPARVLETRKMVLALNRMGLRVVVDVAFNHTFEAGQEPFSVLDKIVPGYYYRLNSAGVIALSSCCPNTATEHVMMEKLMRDAVLHWARVYKIDGFRFDLMGHHMIDNMVSIRADLDALTIHEDGVAGPQILLYGEGWDFGEVAGNARGVNASQQNLGGTGIGSFNDRLRDAGRGGGPFVGLQAQGFLTGLAIDPNNSDQGSRLHQRNHLLYLKDLIRLSLAGNLKEFQFNSSQGMRILGVDLQYRGAAAGYTESPQENILYLAAHDNETLFDAIQYKAPKITSTADRVRMQCLGISLLALAQGIPFFHAGMEILRSKSLDRDSYRSGDWFNYLDYSYQTNNWGVGLPFEDINHANWSVMRELLANPALKPKPDDILHALMHFEEFLKIRMSSPLFHFTTSAAVQESLKFYNTGPDQELGLIVMSLTNHPDERLDARYNLIFGLINVDPGPVEFHLDHARLLNLKLHPVLAKSNDPVVRSSEFDKSNMKFLIPGRTTAVFVQEIE